jgi:uncharacterized iron-regulated membrane protein
MDARFSKRLRSTSHWLHTWFGIIFGAIVSLTCLTGSIVVFRQEADRPFQSAGPARSGILDAAALAIGRLRPETRITRVQFPLHANEPYVFRVKSADNGTRLFAVDAVSGWVLGEMAPAGWMAWTIDLHRSLLAGRPGRNAIGVVGILSFTLALTALLLWMCRGANWKDLITIRRGGSHQFNITLHRAIGLWAIGFMVAISVTGIGLAYSQPLRDTWERITGQSASLRPPRAVGVAVPAPVSLDRYVAAGWSAIPDGKVTELRIPQSAGDPAVVRLSRSGDLSPGSNRVYLDPASGKTLSVDLAANWPLGVRLFQALGPIHYGEFGRAPVKILWSIFGVAPSILFITGLLVWWRPKTRRSRPKMRRKRAELEASPSEVVSL